MESNSENQSVRVLKKLLDSKVLNSHQKSVIEHLILASRYGQECHVAAFLDAMLEAINNSVMHSDFPPHAT